LDSLVQLKDIFKDLTTAEKVREFVDLVKKQDQVDCPTYHFFSPGLYVRQLNVPADTVLVGYKLKHKHLNIFLKGAVTIVIDGEVRRVEAPMIFTGEPGRKIGYVEEDMVWLNVFPTDETDIATLEDMFFDKSDQWTKEELANLGKLNRCSAEREDYESFLKETGFTEAQIRKESEYAGDLVPFPDGMYAIAVFPSPIEGKGLFATASFASGDYIAPARVGIFRTPAGRYTNHSGKPNAKLVDINGDLHLLARKPIRGNQGGIIGDEITIDYRESIQFRPKEV